MCSSCLNTEGELVYSEAVKAEMLESVARGVKLLDEHFDGPGWRFDVNLKEFNISEPDNCILGQLFGDYDHGRMVLGGAGSYIWSRAHGFNSEYNDLLQEVWEEELSKNL